MIWELSNYVLSSRAEDVYIRTRTQTYDTNSLLLSAHRLFEKPIG